MFPKKNHQWDILLGRQLAALRELGHGTLGRGLRGLASGVAVHLLGCAKWDGKLGRKPRENPWIFAGNMDKIVVRLSVKCETGYLAAKTGHVKLETFICFICETVKVKPFFSGWHVPQDQVWDDWFQADFAGGWQLIQAIHSTGWIHIIAFQPKKTQECANSPSSCNSCARDLCRAPRCWRVPARLTRLPENRCSSIHDTHGWSSTAKGSSIFYDNPAAMGVAENRIIVQG